MLTLRSHVQVCDPQLNTLAHSLPSAHCSQSRLVCTMSGTALNENNQPMMLPNGEKDINTDGALVKLTIPLLVLNN